MRSDAARLLKRLLGFLLLAASFGYIGVKLWAQRDAFATFQFRPADLAVLAACTLVYGASNLILSTAWGYLLAWGGQTGVRLAVVRRIYSRTQIAKYIPGNVSQVLLRHTMGRAAGWSHAPLLLSSVLELVSLIAAAAAIALASFLMFGTRAGLVTPTHLAAIIAAAFAVCLSCVYALPQVIKRLLPNAAADGFKMGNVVALAPAVAMHFAFFLLGGLLLLTITMTVSRMALPVGLVNTPPVVALLAVAWVVGMVTPGAPSGLGVREAVLVAGLGSLVPPADALLIAALMRCVTVLGDVAAFSVFGFLTERVSAAGEA